MSQMFVQVGRDSISMTILGRRYAPLSNLQTFDDYADAADHIISYAQANQVLEIRVASAGLGIIVADLIHEGLKARHLDKYIVLWDQKEWSVKTLERRREN